MSCRRWSSTLSFHRQVVSASGWTRCDGSCAHALDLRRLFFQLCRGLVARREVAPRIERGGHCALSAMLTVSQLSKSFTGRGVRIGGRAANLDKTKPVTGKDQRPEVGSQNFLKAGAYH